MTKKGNFKSMIDCTHLISETEIAMLYPEYDSSWLIENIDDLKTILWDMGMDTLNENFTLSEVVQHRNRLGKVVTSARYVGIERSDNDWMKSGYASQAALDKARNSPMTDCLYREKGLTIDMQSAMEAKDKYKSLEDEEQDW